MEIDDTNPQHGVVLLSFYECLTDPRHLDTMMDMLTSWLEDIDGEIVAPKIDYHAEQAWRLLGEISNSAGQTNDEHYAFEQSRFDQKSDVGAALKNKIGAEDFQKLSIWLETETDQKDLLLRVAETESTELVLLSLSLIHI